MTENQSSNTKRVVNHGVVYSFPEQLKHKYRGCGHGQVVICKKTEALLDWDYLDADDQPVDEQTIFMHPDAGELMGETDKTKTIRANFSVWEACLF